MNADPGVLQIVHQHFVGKDIVVDTPARPSAYVGGMRAGGGRHGVVRRVICMAATDVLPAPVGPGGGHRSRWADNGDGDGGNRDHRR